MRLATALVLRAAALSGLWWVLTEGRPGYAGYGTVAVPLALAVSMWLVPPPAALPRGRAGPGSRAVGLVALLGWYAGQVVRGAVDVSRRLLRRRVDVAPVVVEVRARLPRGALRQLAVAMYGLMPGSLVSGTDGDLVQLHSLSEELGAEAQWRTLEERLARTAGLDLTSAG